MQYETTTRSTIIPFAKKLFRNKNLLQPRIKLVAMSLLDNKTTTLPIISKNSNFGTYEDFRTG